MNEEFGVHFVLFGFVCECTFNKEELKDRFIKECESKGIEVVNVSELTLNEV